jgi:hypothetical protein
MSVGNSERTYGKHALLNKILGREAGIMSLKRPGFIMKQYTIVDMCAGDGLPTYISEMSSPQIIYKHKIFMERHGLYPKVFLFEKNKNTFDILCNNYANASFNLDSNTLKYLPNHPLDLSAAFIHADPNLISDWPINPELLLNVPKYTTMLITLGCNVGGLKRLRSDDRKVWFDNLDNILTFLPGWHDALLVVLRGDKAQWAYLITGPKIWHDKGIYIADATKSFSYWKPGIDLIQYKENHKEFIIARDRLFLTKNELAIK